MIVDEGVVRRKANVLGTCPGCKRYVRRVTWFEEPFVGAGDRDAAVERVMKRIADFNPDLTHMKCREQ